MKIKYSLKREGNIIHFKILEAGEKTIKALELYRKFGKSSVNDSHEVAIFFTDKVFGYFNSHDMSVYIDDDMDFVCLPELVFNNDFIAKKAMKLLPEQIKQSILQMEKDFSS